MNIVISGASGMIGSHLARAFRLSGDAIIPIRRTDFSRSAKDFTDNFIEGRDVVINLAGSPISGRWTAEKKEEMLESRISATRKIVQSILDSSSPPEALISASAVGIYNDEKKHTEESAAYASNFLAGLCRNWEEEALKAAIRCRVVIMRMGLALAKDEGALEKMVPVFRIGMGGHIGDGNQGVSWIHIEDLVAMFRFVTEHKEVEGVVNAVGEYPTDNYHFSSTLGKVFQQPSFMRIPKSFIRMIYGEGTSVLIEGQKILPEKMLRHGFVFKFQTVDKALVDLYGGR